MKWLQTYKIHLLMVVFAILGLWMMVMFSKADAENQKLKLENKLLNEKVEVIDNYIYEHSEIKKINDDRSTDFPKHNDTRNCIEYRQCSSSCCNGEGTTKKATKESTNLRNSRSVSF